MLLDIFRPETSIQVIHGNEEKTAMVSFLVQSFFFFFVVSLISLLFFIDGTTVTIDFTSRRRLLTSSI